MNKDKIKQKLKSLPIFYIFFFISLIFAICFGIYKESVNVQSTNANPPSVVFVGNYKIGDNEWEEYDGSHIEIKKDQDVTLKGHFFLIDPSSEEKYPVSKGLMIAFYLNHINVAIEDNSGNKIKLFCEVPQAGESSCGESWQYYRITTEAYEDITITISNPHFFGNPNAVDNLLDDMYLYYATNFEMMILEDYAFERTLSSFVIF